MIERLRGLDTAFLSLERPSAPLQVAQACVFDPSTCDAGYSFEGVRALVEERLELVPPFRRRLVEAPMGIDHPVWIEDPDFDLDDHLHHVVLWRPGGLRELAEFTACVAAQPFDRRRPLWDMYVVEGLDGGLVAGITKIHHCAIDGVSGAELTASLLDFTAEPRDYQPQGDWVPDLRPDPLQLVSSGLAAALRRPMEMAVMAGRIARTGRQLRQRSSSPGAFAPPAPFSAPSTVFDGPVGPRRRLAFGQVNFEDLRVVKDAFGVTINDVILAAVSGTMRSLLERAGALPDEPLVAAVPVSVRTHEDRGALGNRLSTMLVGLATTLEDPVTRLKVIAEGSRQAKEQDGIFGPTLMSDVADLITPILGKALSWAAVRSGVMHRPRPLCNLMVSSYPGPPVPLYCAGARLVAPYPIGPIIDGAPINFTAQTYLDNVYVGINADERFGPDPWEATSRLADSVAELAKVASV